MPRLNSSARSSGPRPGPSQSLPVASARCHSLASFTSVIADLPTGRFRRSARRPTPTTSLADLFVNSLLLASLCHLHSPRNRTLGRSSRLHSDGSFARSQQNTVGNFHLSGRRPLTLSERGSGCRVPKANGTRHAPKYSTGAAFIHQSRDTESEGLPDNSHETPVDQRNPQVDPTQQSAANQTQSSELERWIHRSYAAIDRGQCQPVSPGVRLAPTRRELSPARRIIAAAMKRALRNSEYVLIHLGKVGQHEMPSFPALERFLEALYDRGKSNQYVFRLYRELPSPGVVHLSEWNRGQLLRRFAFPEDRRRAQARRFLALIDDMFAANLPIPPEMWTSAIYFSAHISQVVRKQDVAYSIGLWRRMERVTGIGSDAATFAILFNMAVKAGQFTVADRLMEEMNKRGIELTRQTKISTIFYYGVKGDVEGIFKAYDEFVSSGEIVDTTVLNCLLSALLRTGEDDLATDVYAQMMQRFRELKASPSKAARASQFFPSLAPEYGNYREKTKRLNQLYSKVAELRKVDPEQHRRLQEAVPAIPDTRTFQILLSHCAYKTGDLNAFEGYLRDMKEVYQNPPQALVYLLLFQGFARHGQVGKGWTPQRLLDTWNKFRRVLLDSRVRLAKLVEARLGKKHHGARWEKMQRSTPDIMLSPVVDDIYTPLTMPRNRTESAGNDAAANPAGNRDEMHAAEERSEKTQWEDTLADEEEVMKMFEDESHQDLPTDPEMDERAPRIDNGVFLSRTMIIAILRAFGSCCEPQVILNVWLQIERIWQPWRRTTFAVSMVKEELNAQLEKSRKIHGTDIK